MRTRTSLFPMALALLLLGICFHPGQSCLAQLSVEWTTLQTGHEGRIRCLGFSPDSKFLTTCGADGKVKLWDTATGQLKTTLNHPNLVETVAFSPDSKLLATGGRDAVVRLWDVASGQEKIALKGHTKLVYCLAFSPNGQVLASTGGDGTTRLWDPATAKETGNWKAAGDLAFSRDGKTLVLGGETVRVWDLAARKETTTFAIKNENNAILLSVKFSSAGKTLALGYYGMIRLWDVTTQKQKAVLYARNRPYSAAVNWTYGLAFSPDGKTLASSTADENRATWPGVITFWDVTTGREKLSLAFGHRYGIFAVAFSPDGKLLASGSDDGTVKLWNIVGSKQVGILSGATGAVNAVVFSPDGKTLASATNRVTKIWDVASGRERLTLKGDDREVYAASYSRDGKTLATGGMDATVRLWDTATGKEKGSFQGDKYRVESLAFSTDGKILVVGGANGVKLWDPTTLKEKARLHLAESDEETCRVAISPDGKVLAIGSCFALHLWDWSTLKEMRKIKGSIGGMSFSPDSKTIATALYLTVKGAEVGGVHLWDVDSGKERTVLKVRHRGLVAFSPDGRRLATGDKGDTVKLWEVGTGKEISNLGSNFYKVNSIAFSPDGSLLASGDDQWLVKLWDVTVSGSGK